ncbi:MAG: hypothetical protein WAK01_15625 [Methylocystis sp.]
MIRLILMGVWAISITVGSGYAFHHLHRLHENSAGGGPAAALETHKTREINIPKIRNGAIQGYAVTQLSYVVDSAVEKKAGLPSEVFVADETFRLIYDDESIDFNRLEKVNLSQLAHSLVKNVNVRLRAEVVKDIAFQEFTFLPFSESKTAP